MSVLQNHVKSDDSTSFLNEPLLMEVIKATPDDVESKGRLYANNQPRILLEVLSARTAMIIIVLTFLAFGFGLLIDLDFVTTGFNDDTVKLTTSGCDIITPQNWGCSVGESWTGNIFNLENIISFELTVSQANFSQIINTSSVDSTILLSAYCDVTLYACTESGGCGDSFSTSPTTFYSKNWNFVYQQLNIQIFPSNNQYAVNDLLANGLSNITIVTNVFQNQESIPTKGLVKSYYVNVTYHDNPLNIFIPTNAYVGDSIGYTAYILSRPSQVGTTIPTIIFMFVTVCTLVGFVYILRNSGGKWLTEQKWIVAYLCFLILYQNPFYCVIYYTSNATTGSVYASYVSDTIAQTGFFVIWLMFGDSVRRQLQSPWLFYGPKIFFGLWIFITYMVIVTFQFPNLDPSGQSKQSPVQSVYNWPQQSQQAFVAFSVMYLVLLWVWALRWFILLYVAGRVLAKLPYMNTRYIQLSYRFFSIQATLVIVYYVVQYGVIVYQISQTTDSTFPGVTVLANDINTLFREQTQLFGKVMFLTVYAIILAFLFLPANCMDSNVAMNLQATYVITEEELRPIVKARRRAIQKMNRMQQSLMDQVIKYKPDIFCADLALTMCNLSFEMYYDPPGMITPSGFGHEPAALKEMELEKYGYRVTDVKYDTDHDTFCCIARHNAQNKIVVMFRGTSSSKHWNDNLNYTQMSVDFNNLSLPGLDAIDGLDVPEDEKNSILKTLASFSPFSRMAQKDDGFEDEEAGEETVEETAGPNSVMGMANFHMGSGSFADKPPPSLLKTTIKEGTNTVVGGVVGGVKLLGNAVVGTTATVVGATTTVVGATTDLMASAAAQTPVLQNIVKPFVHSGFWDAYSVVREFVHAVLRRELSASPAHVYFTGHSLGGALATLCSLDVSINTLPRVNRYIRHKRDVWLASQQGNDQETGSAQPLVGVGGGGQIPSEATVNWGKKDTVDPFHNLHRVRATMYNYGCPRLGNRSFSQFYDKIMPDSFRVVVDGDIVTGIPSYGFKHVGTLVLVDDIGAGSIIIDPSFVERRLRMNNRSSVAVHSLLFYRNGIQSVIDASIFMDKYATTLQTNIDEIDSVRLAIHARKQIQEKKTGKSERSADPGAEDTSTGTSTNLLVSGEVESPMAVNEERKAGDTPLTPTAHTNELTEAEQYAQEYSSHNRSFLDGISQSNKTFSARFVDSITPAVLKRHDAKGLHYANPAASSSDD